MTTLAVSRLPFKHVPAHLNVGAKTRTDFRGVSLVTARDHGSEFSRLNLVAPMSGTFQRQEG